MKLDTLILFLKLKRKADKNDKLIRILTSSVNNTKRGSELNDITPNNAFRQHTAMLLSQNSVFGVTVRPWRIGIRREWVGVTIELGRGEMLIQQRLRSGMIIVDENHG